MIYLNKENAVSALRKMAEFESKLYNLYSSFNIDVRDNLGRRNMLLSQAQEIFFCEEIVRNGIPAVCSGKTGEPDIVIENTGREVECKLTSGSRSAWPLQCDYSTLERKGSLDFLYVLCNKNFNQFAVLLFSNLTIGDFYFPAPGSRQKARMNKGAAMKKCEVLIGEVKNKNSEYIEKYSNELADHMNKSSKRLSELKQRSLQSRTQAQKKSLSSMIKREAKRFQSKELKIKNKIDYWANSEQRYTIVLDSI